MAFKITDLAINVKRSIGRRLGVVMMLVRLCARALQLRKFRIRDFRNILFIAAIHSVCGYESLYKSFIDRGLLNQDNDESTFCA